MLVKFRCLPWPPILKKLNDVLPETVIMKIFVVRQGNSSKNCLFLTFSRFWRETQSVLILRYQTLWSKMLHSHSSQLWLDSLELCWSPPFLEGALKKFRRFYDDTAPNCMKLHEKWTVSEMRILISKILGWLLLKQNFSKLRIYLLLFW